MKYLLDTNACIGYLRGKNQHLLGRFGSHPPSDILLCAVVVGELRYGAERSTNPPQQHALVDAFVGQFASLPYDDVAARVYAEIRRNLTARGLPIGPYDYQIAAIALAHGLTPVTHNTKEFSRVPGLTLEDWEVP